MKKLYVLLSLSILFVSISGCQKESDDFYPIQGLTLSNYPKVDCSTSTQLLQTLIACKLLGVSYEWEENLLFGGFYDLRVNYNDLEGSMAFFDNLPVSTTNGAFLNLIDWEVDLIVVSRSISRDEKAYAEQQGVTLLETPIALDGFIFIGNHSNPVDNLTQKQIQDIYLGTITNWSEVGGKNESIIPFVREPNSGSQEKMETIIMKGLDMPSWEYTTLTGMSGPFDRLRYVENGICYSLYYYNTYFVEPDLVKQFTIDGVKPTKSTIRDKSYPYTTEVYVAIRSDEDKNSMAYKMYEFLCSDSAKDVIEESGYVAR